MLLEVTSFGTPLGFELNASIHRSELIRETRRDSETIPSGIFRISPTGLKTKKNTSPQSQSRILYLRVCIGIQGATGRNPIIYGITSPARTVANYTTASLSTLDMCQSGRFCRWLLPQVELGRPRRHGEVQEKHLEALHHANDKSQRGSSELRLAACSAPTRRTSCCLLGNMSPRQHADRTRYRHT